MAEYRKYRLSNYFGLAVPFAFALAIVISLLANSCTDSLGLEEKVIITPITKDTLPDTTHKDTIKTKRYQLDSIVQTTFETVYIKKGSGVYDTMRISPYPIQWRNISHSLNGFIDSINGAYYLTMNLKISNLSVREIVTPALEKIQSYFVALDSMLIEPGPFFRLNTSESDKYRRFSAVEILYGNTPLALTRTVSMQFVNFNPNYFTIKLYNERPTQYTGQTSIAMQMLEATILIFYSESRQ